MVDTEALANYVAANTSQSYDQDSYEHNRNYLVPKPPKKGEYIICSNCGKEMRPEDFSKDKSIRKWEFKWHMHWKCREELLNLCDEESGILEDRKNPLGVSNIDGYITPEQREYIMRSRRKRGV